MNWPCDPGRSWNRPPASGEFLHPPAPSRQPHPNRYREPEVQEAIRSAGGLGVVNIRQIRVRRGHFGSHIATTNN